MSLDSMKEIFDRMEAEHKPFWEIVLETDMDERQVTRQQSMAKMLTTWQYMVDAADTYTGRRRSVSGLVGGDGLKMRQYSIRGRAMSGGYVSEVIAEALSMAESNACMRRIVAAPTAGACGVLPAVLLPLCKYEELSQHRILEALYVASGIGAVIAYKACIAGASGGCQAEIGSVCSGGRYDNLAEFYTDKQLPGVGISIGLTRLFYVLGEQGMLNPELPTAPADVLILPMTEDLSPAIALATQLRQAGIRTQLHCEQKKFKAKMSYADKLSIPYVIFLGEDEISVGVVACKDMKSGEQTKLNTQETIDRIKAGLAELEKGSVIVE